AIGSRSGIGRQTDGQLCWQADSGACRRTITAAISLSRSGKSGDDRQTRRCRRTRSHSAQGLYWLDVLGGSAHLLFNWHQKSFHCRDKLAVELRTIAARGPPYYRGSPNRPRRIALSDVLGTFAIVPMSIRGWNDLTGGTCATRSGDPRPSSFCPAASRTVRR